MDQDDGIFSTFIDFSWRLFLQLFPLRTVFPADTLVEK